MNFIKNRFPNVDFSQIGEINYEDKENETGKIVAHGPKGGKTKVIVQNKSGFGFKLSEKFLNKYKTFLGKKAESVILQENEEPAEIERSRKTIEKSRKDRYRTQKKMLKK